MLTFPTELGTNDSIPRYSSSTVVWKHFNYMWPEFKMPNSRFLSISVSYYCGAAEVGVFQQKLWHEDCRASLKGREVIRCMWTRLKQS